MRKVGEHVEWDRNQLKHGLMMATAKLWSRASHSERLQVGAVLAREGRIIAIGYNGRLPNEPHVCETEDGVTRDDVVHAEENVLIFCAKHGIPTAGATLYCTDSPCIRCARMLISAEVKEIYYLREYRDPEPIKLMRSHNIKCSPGVLYE